MTTTNALTVKVTADTDEAVANLRTLRTEAIKARRATRRLGLVSNNYVGLAFFAGVLLGELVQRVLG